MSLQFGENRSTFTCFFPGRNIEQLFPVLEIHCICEIVFFFRSMWAGSLCQYVFRMDALCNSFVFCSVLSSSLQPYWYTWTTPFVSIGVWGVDGDGLTVEFVGCEKHREKTNAFCLSCLNYMSVLVNFCFTSQTACLIGIPNCSLMFR